MYIHFVDTYLFDIGMKLKMHIHVLSVLIGDVIY